MVIITCNVNGIRAAAAKGFFTWLKAQGADIVCLQEVKAQKDQLIDSVFYPENYHVYYHLAAKKGYSGVAIYCKHQPLAVIEGIGDKAIDAEGRYLAIKYTDVTIASIYFPSGTSGDERQVVKFRFMEHYFNKLQEQLKEKHSYIICGDWNIAHQKIDLKNWRSNQKNSGFLPEERAYMDKVFSDLGYIDTFRFLYPEKVAYTWWSYRASAWAKDVGWRIDYQVTTPDLKDKIKNAAVYREEKFSDHAPLRVVYDIKLEQF